jgi:L-cysteine desulfidase
MNTKMFLAQEVKPAFGCTEPVAVALAAAIAGREHKHAVENIDVRMSINIFKNSRSVGLPGLQNLRGIDLAAAIGALGGDPDKGLMVLEGISPELVEKASALVKAGRISQAIAEDAPVVWTEVAVRGEGHYATCTLSRRHDRVETLIVDGRVLFEAPQLADDGSDDILLDELKSMTMDDLWSLSMNIDTEEKETLLEGARMNMAVAQAGMTRDWGMGTGLAQESGEETISSAIRRATAGASEVRMNGGNYPVMSSAGSGNHGITAIIPVVVAAKRLKAGDATLAKALMLSHLVCGYLKAHTGRLTPICGCAMAAGAGASAGIVLLQGGISAQAERAVVTFVASLLGMFCDGGKETCSLKVGTAAAEAWTAASLAMHGGGVRMEQGLVAVSLRETGAILASLSKGLFRQLDRHLASIMLERETALAGASGGAREGTSASRP